MQGKQGDVSASMVDVRRFMTVHVGVRCAFVNLLLGSCMCEISVVTDLVVTSAQCDTGCGNII